MKTFGRKWSGKEKTKNAMGGLRYESEKSGRRTENNSKRRNWRLLIENAVREKLGVERRQYKTTSSLTTGTTRGEQQQPGAYEGAMYLLSLRVLYSSAPDYATPAALTPSARR